MGAIAPVDFQKGSIAPVNFEEEINHKTDERELGTVLKIGRCDWASTFLKIHGCNWAIQISRLGVDEKDTCTRGLKFQRQAMLMNKMLFLKVTCSLFWP